MIIKLMVDMVAPQPSDEICDPACGTAGFLVAASEYVRNTHPHALQLMPAWTLAQAAALGVPAPGLDVGSDQKPDTAAHVE